MKKYLGLRKANIIIGRFRKARVLVIGDLIMDHFIWGKVRRISPEAPVPVVEVSKEDLMLGGAANVANNISSLGGAAVVTGVVGRDDDGRRFVRELKAKGLPVSGIITDQKRPTTIKTRVIAHNQQVVRFDRELKEKISQRTAAKVIDFVRKAVRSADVVVISDYAKGLITEALVQETRDLCARLKKKIAVDPKVEHFGYYRGVSIVTPNNLEASLASGVEIGNGRSLHRAGEILFNQLGCEALLITRGEHGMSLFEPDSDTHIPTVAQEVYDVSGAGDTVIGVLALALASGANYKEASVLANLAAGVVVGKIGTATVTLDELRRAVRHGLEAWPKDS